MTAVVCDGCDGEFELPRGTPVPKGDWFCPACQRGSRRLKREAGLKATGASPATAAAAAGGPQKRPRGRAPNGEDGRPKVWCAAQAKFVDDTAGAAAGAATKAKQIEALEAQLAQLRDSTST